MIKDASTGRSSREARLQESAESEFAKLKSSPPEELLSAVNDRISNEVDATDEVVELGRYVVKNFPSLARVWAGSYPSTAVDSHRAVRLRNSVSRQSESLPRRFERTVGHIAALTLLDAIEPFAFNAVTGDFTVVSKGVAAPHVGRLLREGTLLAASAPVAFPPYADQSAAPDLAR